MTVVQTCALPICLPYDPNPDESVMEMVKRPRSNIPAVTHVDYSARIQTVRADDHPAFHSVIEEFRNRTGCGLVVNTSFNVNGEPIVCTPEDAYRCFIGTDMDALVLGDALLWKSNQPSRSLLPERPSPTSTSGSSSYPDDLLEALRRVFEETFLPVARELESSGELLGDWGSDDNTSMWRVYTPPGDLFEIAGVLHDSMAEPTQLARATLRHWQPGAVADAIEPTLVELLTIGRDHLALPDLGAEITPTVPGSAYIMY